MKTALAALLAAAPKELSVSVGGKDYRSGTPLEITDFTLTPQQQKILESVVNVCQDRGGEGNAAVAQASNRIKGRGRSEGFVAMFDALSGCKARIMYLVTVSATASGAR